MTTTIEPTTLPKWEAESTNYQHLSWVNGDTVRDPGYLYARMREIITHSSAVAAVEYPDDSEMQCMLEAALLRDRLSDLAAELRAHTQAADEFLTVLESVAPAVHWHRGSRGFFGGTEYGSDLAVAVSAARTLRLTETEPLSDSRSWAGQIEGWRVRIYHYCTGEGQR